MTEDSRWNHRSTITFVSGPLTGNYQRVHVWSDGDQWYMQTIGGKIEAKAACVKFRSKLAAPFRTGVTGPVE